MKKEQTATAGARCRNKSAAVRAMFGVLALGAAACSAPADTSTELNAATSPAAASPTASASPSASAPVAGRSPTAVTRADAGTSSVGRSAAAGSSANAAVNAGSGGSTDTNAGAGGTAGEAAGADTNAGAGAVSAGAGGATAAGSSGSGGAAAGGGGSTSAAGSGGNAGILAAGTGGAGQAGGAGSAGQAGAAGSTSGGELDEYGQPGPHKVTIEKNVGRRFRNAGVYDDTLECRAFIAGAASGDPNADPMVIEELTTYPSDMDRALYTLFRPETLEEGKKYPVITWGNGTCSHPLLFEELLTHIASHGFIIIATNWRWVASGREMLNGVDFILSENENETSPLFGKVDTTNIGATGHSQGSGATVVVGADSRIATTVPIQGASASDVARLKGPTFLIAGELDMLVSPQSVETAFDAATVPAVYGLVLGKDHLMPGLDPTPILKPITTWFKIHLAGDTAARDFFYGDSCGLCADPTWKVQRKNQ